jgi:hypothetical protein
VMLEESNESPHNICFGHVNVQVNDRYSGQICASGNHQNTEDVMKCMQE